MTRVFVIAGEPSGDRLGGAAMAGLRQLEPEITFSGVGGPQMAAQGLQSRFDMEELSVMGLAEVLPRLRPLLRRIEETAQAAIAERPDVLLTIDSPDFCLRVAARVRAAAPGIRTVHYVAPSVWAWRPKRAVKMARHIDEVLALLPFEPPYMQAAGMDCTFVGHPVVAEPVASPAAVRAFRETYAGDGPLILALPGSRRGEVTRLMPRFGATLARVLAQRPGARVVLPMAAPVAGLVREMAQDWPQVHLLDPAAPDAEEVKRAAFAAADVALAASGTVSLELAAADTPMVIGYDAAWLTRQIIGRMMRIDTVTLVNLVSETRAVPEFIGAACRPEAMAEALLQQIADPAPQRAALSLTMERLGRDGPPPGLRAARALLEGLRGAG